MKLKTWAQFPLDIALNASEGTLISPAAQEFIPCDGVTGLLSSHMVRCCGTSSRMVELVGLWLLKTLWKCGYMTDMFSVAFVASLPSGSLIAMFLILL